MSNEQQTSAPDQDVPPPLPRRELTRPTDQRVLAGVASGLADYWGVSAGWIRVAFLVLAVFGGSGLLLYLGLWVILPKDDGTESVLESAIRQARDGESWIGVILITVAIVIALSSFSWIDGSLAWAVGLLLVGYLLYQGAPFFSPTTSDSSNDAPEATATGADGARTDERTSPARAPRPPKPPRTPRPKKPPTILGRLSVAFAFLALGALALADTAGADIRPHHYVGASLAVVATALLLGTWFGRAKWLIVVGLLLLPAAAVTRVSDLNFDLNFSDIETQVVVVDTLSELESEYTFEAADVTFDLTALPLEELPGDATLTVTMDVGQVTVILPEELAASVHAEVGIGDVTIGAQSSSGFGASQTTTFDGSGDPLNINVDVGIGSVLVYEVGTG